MATLAWCDMRSRDAPFSRLPRKMARNPTPLFLVVCLPSLPQNTRQFKSGGPTTFERMPRCDVRKKSVGESGGPWHRRAASGWRRAT